MLETPPAVIVFVPGVPADFTIAPRTPDPFRLQQNCGSSPNEIVICGRRKDESYRLGPLLPDTPSDMDEIAAGKNLGPVRVRPEEVHGVRSSGPGISFSIKF